MYIVQIYHNQHSVNYSTSNKLNHVLIAFWIYTHYIGKASIHFLNAVLFFSTRRCVALSASDQKNKHLR